MDVRSHVHALFNIVLEWIMRRTPSENDVLRFRNGVIIDRLGYADDADFMKERYYPRDR